MAGLSRESFTCSWDRNDAGEKEDGSERGFPTGILTDLVTRERVVDDGCHDSAAFHLVTLSVQAEEHELLTRRSDQDVAVVQVPVFELIRRLRDCQREGYLFGDGENLKAVHFLLLLPFTSRSIIVIIIAVMVMFGSVGGKEPIVRFSPDVAGNDDKQ